MFSLIAAESAIFTIFVVAYIFYIGKSLSGPTPKDVLAIPIFITICLLSSSLTIHLAVRSVRNANIVSFGFWWFLTLTLGTIFLVGTGREWHKLIFHEGLTISTNLFGPTYYSLVGLHAFLDPFDIAHLHVVSAETLAHEFRQRDGDEQRAQSQNDRRALTGMK